MRYYPIYLDIQEKDCLVVGGGAVGARKAGTLLECGALVTVVSPEFTDKIHKLTKTYSITLKKRPFSIEDLNGKFLVMGATDDASLNRTIHKEALRRNMLCNIADSPGECNFILPSIVNRGDLSIAISTSGKSPAFAKNLRKRLEKQFGNEYAIFLALMGKIREKLLAEAHEPEAHKHLFEQLIAKGIIELIKNNEKDGINSILLDVLGVGYKFDELMENE